MQEVSLRELTKTFSGVHAIDHVSIDFHAGEIHAVLGENGAGKSTLMHLLSGLYRPDAGSILLDGLPQVFSSARVALAAGIAMVHQHFMLVPTLTVAENILLALPGRTHERVRRQQLAQHITTLAQQYGVEISDPHALVSSLPVGSQQRVEILKALATNARVLILDEPTAVLTPNEVKKLFASLHKLKQDGYLILLITHKIPEVLTISDRLSVLRKGQLITTRKTSLCSAADLAQLMVEEANPGRILSAPSTPHVAADQAEKPIPLVTLQDVSMSALSGRQALQRISFKLSSGEIVGIAGVDGNGQTELAELLIGLRAPSEGTLRLKEQIKENPTPAFFRAAGVSIIPQDRRREGLALQFSIAENLLLNTAVLSQLEPGVKLHRDRMRRFAENSIARFSISPPNPDQPVATLSGGNQQRVVIARELSVSPQIIIAVNPSRGLDIGATHYVHHQLKERKKNGAGIVLISTDLDEILSLSDRVYVLYQGQLLGPVNPHTSQEQLGRLLGGAWKEHP